jgi:hypothetical protein
MPRLFSRRYRRIALIMLALIVLAICSPSYSRVIVKGDGVDLDVTASGFGPQRVNVQTDNAKIETATR